MRKVKISIWVLIVIVAIVLGIYFNYHSESPIIPEEAIIEKNVELYFYDLEENCTLDGEVFIEHYSLGNTKNGILLLNESLYEDKFFENARVSIIGTTDYCFGKDSDLPFKEVWEVPNLEYYFEYKKPLLFEAEVSPRRPYYPEEMQGFVRPEEVAESLSKININENDSQSENIEKILRRTYLNWVSDSLRFGKAEYWQTPLEFIHNKGGDCEDWAVYFLSLLRKYDSNLNCYAAVWHTHVNVLCQINQTFIILDQDKIRTDLVLHGEWSIQDNQIAARSWRNNYFRGYGIDPDERILYYLFNEEEYIEFENGQEDLIDWILKTAGITNF